MPIVAQVPLKQKMCPTGSLGMERCGKRNAGDLGAESWTGIGVVAGCAVVMLLTQGPHVQDIATYWGIKLLQILQEVGSICKTRNHL
jgi:hypothetical protein